MKIGVLTGGGDCAGLNAAIQAIVKRSINYGYRVLGIRRGWAGLLELDVSELTLSDVKDIMYKGGTILKTSRTNPLKISDGLERVMTNLRSLGVDVLIVIGGDDTHSVAKKLDERGFKVLGIPKTIDNDLYDTDYTIGFDSAVNVAVDAIDRIRTTGESHERVMVVEVMGRDAGWVAIEAGVAGGADLVLIPEEPFDIELVCDYVRRKKSSGRSSLIIVVAEGAYPKKGFHKILVSEKKDQFGHARLGGIGQLLAEKIEVSTGFESRAVTLGHLVRGGSPSAFDRILATRLGFQAVESIREGVSGVMLALKGTDIVPIPLKSVSGNKTVDRRLISMAEALS